MVLLIAVAIVAAFIARHSPDRGQLRLLAVVGGLAIAARLAAIAVVNYLALQVHGTGVWLNDEASFFLATESLMPWPWDKALPPGLDHLGGDGWLGFTTAVSLLDGKVESLALRFANAGLGSLVALLCASIGQHFFGRRAGLVAGIGAAVWPDLVLWSATFLRDTIASLAVVAVWYTLVTTDRRRWLPNACFVLLSLVLLESLRDYLAFTTAVGVGAWLIYPLAARQRPRTLVAIGGGIVALGLVVGSLQARRIDAAIHELFYRQTVTRMETLGRLYRDPPPPNQPIQLPFRPGTAIAVAQPNSDWVLTGLVEDSAEPGYVHVGLTDDTSRSVPIGDVVLLQDVRIPPWQLLSWVLPSLGAVFVGLPTTDQSYNGGWIAAALAWDALLVMSVVAIVRTRLSPRYWIIPLCVALGTIAALSAIPGAPGNAERHRAAQTLPLLLVLAGGLLRSRQAIEGVEGRAVSSTTSMPPSATTAVASVRRSER